MAKRLGERSQPKETIGVRKTACSMAAIDPIGFERCADALFGKMLEN